MKGAAAAAVLLAAWSLPGQALGQLSDPDRELGQDSETTRDPRGGLEERERTGGPQLGISVGVGTTDNVGRNAQQIDSDLSTLGLTVDVRHTTRRIDGAVFGDVQYRSYSADVLDDNNEEVGALDGRLAIQLVPSRFSWELEQNFGQVRSDPLEAVGPANRQNTSVFSTGPRVEVPIGDKNAIGFGARVSERRYDSTDQIDSRLTDRNLVLSRALTPVARVELRLDDIENEFENDLGTYSFRIASVTYGKQFSSGGVEISLGRGDIEINGESDSTTVSRFNWSRRVGSRSTLVVWAGRELTDAGEIFRVAGMPVTDLGAVSGLIDPITISDNRLLNVVVSSSPLRRNVAGARLQIEGARTTFRVDLGAADDRFEIDSTLDNESRVIRAQVTRELGLRWWGEASLAVTDQDFGGIGRSSEDSFGTLTVVRTLGMRTSLSFAYERHERDSLVDPYGENVFIVSVGHNFSRR